MADDSASRSQPSPTITMALLTMAAALLLSLWASQPAWADANYTVDELSTELTVLPNGSGSVVNRQVLTFDGPNKGYTWYLRQPGMGESVRIEGIWAAPVDDGGTLLDGWTRLQMIDVAAEDQGQWPGDAASPTLREENTQPWYSYDLATGFVRSWFPADSGTYMVETDYTVSNLVYAYRDIAELSWRYAHASMPVNSTGVTLHVVLPVPEGTTFQPGQDVIAWGHGPHDARFELLEDGTAVYQIDYLETGHYGEAHIIFPSSWLTQLAPNTPHLYTELHKQEVLSQESKWVDASLREANWDFKVRVICFLLAALVLLFGVIFVLRFGMTARSRRALIRVAAIIGIEALAVNLFFMEPYTVWGLAIVAAVVAVAALCLPQGNPGKTEKEEEPHGSER